MGRQAHQGLRELEKPEVMVLAAHPELQVMAHTALQAHQGQAG